jgi:hypothetical protein
MNKSIRIELGSSKFSPNFGETSQNLSCIKLFILSPKWILSDSITKFNAQNLYAILFFIVFLILAPSSLLHFHLPLAFLPFFTPKPKILFSTPGSH